MSSTTHRNHPHPSRITASADCMHAEAKHCDHQTIFFQHFEAILLEYFAVYSSMVRHLDGRTDGLLQSAVQWWCGGNSAVGAQPPLEGHSR